MATKTKPLTNTEVKQAKPRERLYKRYDGDGLQLRIMPSGSKIWLFDYKRPYTKKRTCLSLGAYPTLSIADARKKRTEAAGARWDEINLETAIWHIPAERMKRKQEHIIPLSRQCLALLELMKPISGRSQFVFPSDRDPRKHSNPQTANTALKRMGFDKKLVAQYAVTGQHHFK